MKIARWSLKIPAVLTRRDRESLTLRKFAIFRYVRGSGSLATAYTSIPLSSQSEQEFDQQPGRGTLESFIARHG
jgi:hypothetical protein